MHFLKVLKYHYNLILLVSTKSQITQKLLVRILILICQHFQKNYAIPK